MARIRATLVAFAFLLTPTLGDVVVASAIAPAAGATGSHRAMVVVDTGSTTYRQVVTFSADSVTGVQALDLAGAAPVVYSYAGQGGAVCKLFGVGRDASPSCLGGADGDNRYWAYFRAPAGTTTFTYSRAGAGSTQVHDGDVEGWKFGTGAAPDYAPLPPVTTTTTAPAVGPGAIAPGRPPAAAGPTGGGPDAATAGGLAAPIDADALRRIAAAATTSSTAAPGSRSNERPATEVAGTRTARSAHGSVTGEPGGGGGGAGSLAIFAVVAAGLVGGGLFLRRSRRRAV